MRLSIDVRHAPKEVDYSSYHGLRVVAHLIIFGSSWMKRTSRPTE